MRRIVASLRSRGRPRPRVPCRTTSTTPSLDCPWAPPSPFELFSETLLSIRVGSRLIPGRFRARAQRSGARARARVVPFFPYQQSGRSAGVCGPSRIFLEDNAFFEHEHPYCAAHEIAISSNSKTGSGSPTGIGFGRFLYWFNTAIRIYFAPGQMK